ncbi:MAG: S46 family peptidase, partial [Bacteroidota bacterium]
DGEMKGLKRLNAVEKKKKQEEIFKLLLEANDSRKKKYGSVLYELENKYTKLKPLSIAYDYFAEAGMAIELVKFTNSFTGLVKAAGDPANTPGKLSEMAKKQKGNVTAFFKNYYAPIDQEMMECLLQMYAAGSDKANRPDVFEMIEKKYKNDFNKYAAEIFKKSMFASEEKLNSMLDKFSSKSVKTVELDPAWILMSSMYGFFYQKVQPEYGKILKEIELLMRTYVAGTREMETKHKFYPDANSTLRISFGNIADYRPRDAVVYDYYTTLDGVMAKEDTNVFDYKVPVKLKELYNKKDYGRYAENGVINVCFTGTNHTTGGNSGSPVLDANGYLIGLNFDRCFEGTMSDIMYDPNYCRNITLDIRYALFIIDKFAGASNLIKEMKIID